MILLVFCQDIKDAPSAPLNTRGVFNAVPPNFKVSWPSLDRR